MLVWRYLDLWKFESFLLSGFYLCRLDQLGDDDYEGLPHDDQREFHRIALEAVKEEVRKARGNEVASQIASPEMFYEATRLRVYASCWQMAPREFLWMWDKYCSSPETAVAIRTTRGKLRDAVPRRSDTFHDVLIEPVAYRSGRNADPTAKMLSKRERYANEQELRVLCDLRGAGDSSKGFFLRVDPNDLADAFVLSPYATERFGDEVAALCRRFGCRVEVAVSSLRGDVA
jgi:hypothetical protein